MRAVPLVLTFLLLAGCLGAQEGGVTRIQGGASTSGGPAVGSVTVSPSDPAAETGSIEGTVMDEELRPIPNATISIPRLAAQALTGVEGSFSFQGVPVGAHSIEAFAFGFSAVQKLADVRAKAPARIEFVLAQLVAQDSPFHQVFPFSGSIPTSVAWNITGTSSNLLLESVMKSFNFSEWPGFAHAVLEATWKPNTAQATDLGAEIQLVHHASKERRVLVGQTNAAGAPVLRAEITDLSIKQWLIRGAGEGSCAAPHWCALDVYFEPHKSGPGVAVFQDQRFESFLSVFFHAPAPPGYTVFTED